MRTYASSWVKRKSFYRNIEFQTFLLIYGGHIGAQNRCTNMASPYKALQFAWNVSANNSETAGHKDLRLGQIFYILVFYNIAFSWLLLLNGFQFIFLLRDSENDLYRKLPKISPGAFFFSMAIFEGLLFGGAYLRREICVYKSIGLAL